MTIIAAGRILPLPDDATDEEVGQFLRDHKDKLDSYPMEPAGHGAGVPAGGPSPAAAKQSLLGAAGEGAGNLLYGTAKGLADPIYGLSQTGLHLINSGYQKLRGPDMGSVVTGKNSNGLQQLTDRYDKFLRDGERQYQSETDGSFLAGLGRVAGNLAPLAATLGASAPATAATAAPVAVAKAPLATRAIEGALTTAANAAKGAAWSGSAPVYSSPNGYWDAKKDQAEVSAVLGAAAPTLVNVARNVRDAARPFTAPAKMVANNILRGVEADAGASAPAAGAPQTPGVSGLTGVRSPQEVIARIDGRQRYVDGSKPTTAQVVNTQQLSMAEKALENNPDYLVEMGNRANANNAARIAKLRAFAGTPEDLQRALEARHQATSPLYDAAFAKEYPVDPELADILASDIGKQALAEARRQASRQPAASRPAGLVEGTPEQTVPTGLLDAQGNPMMATVPGKNGTIDGQSLKYIESALRGLVPENAAGGGIAGLDAGSKQKMVGRVADWLSTNAPEYKAADALWRQHSEPVNAMRTGQAALEALGAPAGVEDGALVSSVDQLGKSKPFNSSGDTALTLSNFNAAVNKAKNAEYGSQFLTPEAVQTLSSIEKDLQRQSGGSSSIRAKGSDSVYNLQAPSWLSRTLYGGGLDGSGSGSAIMGAATGAAGATLGFLNPELTHLTGPIAEGAGLVGGALLGGGSGLTIGGKIANAGASRVDAVLQDAMLNPDRFKELLLQGLQQRANEAAYAPTPATGALSEVANTYRGDQ